MWQVREFAKNKYYYEAVQLLKEIKIHPERVEKNFILTEEEERKVFDNFQQSYKEVERALADLLEDQV